MSGTIRGIVPSVLLQPDIKHVVYRMVEIVAIFAKGFYCLSRGQFLLFAILAGIGGRSLWLVHARGRTLFAHWWGKMNARYQTVLLDNINLHANPICDGTYSIFKV